MGYEILSDDLIDNGQDPNSKGPGPIKRFLSRINPFHLNIILILIIGSLIGFFLIKNIDFDFSFSNNETGILTLTGNFDDFNQTYDGNLSIYSGKFEIKTSSGTFQGESKTIELENFTGLISQKNKSLVFNGTANSIKFGSNEINSNNKEIYITSSGKTQTNFILEQIYFPKLQGNAKLDSALNYGFEDSSIQLTNFKTQMTYDGTYTFTGQADKFEILSNKNKLKIVYDRNLSINQTN